MNDNKIFAYTFYKEPPPALIIFDKYKTFENVLFEKMFRGNSFDPPIFLGFFEDRGNITAADPISSCSSSLSCSSTPSLYSSSLHSSSLNLDKHDVKLSKEKDKFIKDEMNDVFDFLFDELNQEEKDDLIVKNEEQQRIEKHQIEVSCFNENINNEKRKKLIEKEKNIKEKSNNNYEHYDAQNLIYDANVSKKIENNIKNDELENFVEFMEEWQESDSTNLLTPSPYQLEQNVSCNSFLSSLCLTSINEKSSSFNKNEHNLTYFSKENGININNGNNIINNMNNIYDDNNNNSNNIEDRSNNNNSYNNNNNKKKYSNSKDSYNKIIEFNVGKKDIKEKKEKKKGIVLNKKSKKKTKNKINLDCIRLKKKDKKKKLKNLSNFNAEITVEKKNNFDSDDAFIRFKQACIEGKLDTHEINWVEDEMDLQILQNFLISSKKHLLYICIACLFEDGSTSTRWNKEIIMKRCSNQSYLSRFPPEYGFALHLKYEEKSVLQIKNYFLCIKNTSSKFQEKAYIILVDIFQNNKIKLDCPVICFNIQECIRPLLQIPRFIYLVSGCINGVLDPCIMCWLIRCDDAENCKNICHLLKIFLHNEQNEDHIKLGYSVNNSDFWNMIFDDNKKSGEIVLAQKKFIEEMQLNEVLIYQEMPISIILSLLDTVGISFDSSVLQKHQNQLVFEMKCLQEKANSVVGKNFLISSPTQVSQILFEYLHLPLSSDFSLNQKLKKPHKSTSDKVLKELFSRHPVVEIIQKYRQVAKLFNTYIEPLKPLTMNKNEMIFLDNFNKNLNEKLPNYSELVSTFVT